MNWEKRNIFAHLSWWPLPMEMRTISPNFGSKTNPIYFFKIKKWHYIRFFFEITSLCKKFKIIHWWCRVIFLCSKILQSANSFNYSYLQIWSYFVKKQLKIIENYKLRKETIFAHPSLWQLPMDILDLCRKWGQDKMIGTLNCFFSITTYLFLSITNQ